MNLLKFTTLTCTTIGLALAGSAFAAEKEKGHEKITACDKAWAHMAAVSDKMEITLAKAAESKAQNPQVKEHAQQMIQDHSKTTAALKKWAEANNVDLMAELPPEKQAVAKEIEAKSGAEFDKAYMNHEVEGHRHAAVHFQNGVEFVMNPELKQFAQENQATINQHLAMTEQQAGAQRTGDRMTSGHGAMPAGQQQPAGTLNSAGQNPARAEVKAQ